MLKNRMKPVKIIAHRGYSLKYPENTLRAFSEAIRAGISMIEVDTALSKDRVPVVMHDNSIDRTTNGKGMLQDYSLTELEQFDAGSWFDPSFKNEKISTLSDILKTFGSRCMINVEIKEEAFEPVERKDSIENQILKLVAEYGLLDTVLISSFNFKILERIYKKNTGIPLGVLMGKNPGEDVFEFCRKVKAFSLNMNYMKVTDKIVEKAKKEGLFLFTYTVNSHSRYQKLMDMGVDAVFSDDSELV
jgi:glycerophosphoryl diester phosphodiesterase